MAIQRTTLSKMANPGHPMDDSMDGTEPWQQFADRRTRTSTARSPKRPMRRVISREQGRALETIGHAVDYLSDCLLMEGPDDELVTGCCPATEAVQILISLHLELLHSLPLVEPMPQRIWNAIFRRLRNPPNRDSRVVPLSLR